MSELLKYFRGYVIVFAKGPYMERFFQQCGKRGLMLWNIEVNNDGYTFMVSKNAFGIVSDLAKATGSDLSILKKIGLPFLLHQYRKRKLFILGCLVALSALYVFSLFLWDISIDGATTYSKKEILSYMTKNCVHAGEPLKEIDCIQLEEKLRNHFSKTAWVSCELKGTQLLVHMKEIIPLKEYTKETRPSDLVASKDGTIAKLAMREGILQVKVGQYVKAGDLLVSGRIEYHDDGGTLTKVCGLAASADVIAKTQCDYSETLEYVRYKKKYIKGNKYSVCLHIGSKKIYLLPFVDKFTKKYKNSQQKEYDQKSKLHKMKLGKTFYFPLQLEIITAKPYMLKRVEYSKKQLQLEAKQHLQAYCDNLSQKGVEITGNNVTIKDVDDKLVVSGPIYMLEPIGKRNYIDSKIKKLDNNIEDK